MMYSDIDIKKAIESGDLKVEPFVPEMIKSASLTMHLGEKLLRPIPGTLIDVKKKQVPKYEEIIITEDNPYCMNPGDFVLGHTLQKVTVGQNLGFFIEGRSTLARIGLTIVQTAMLVYPGHTNRGVTLELANHGNNPILLYPNMKVARAALIELKTSSSCTYDEEGKYRDQEEVGPPIFSKEIQKFD